MVGKRQGYLSWDEYFMAVAILSGLRSKDPNTQVGACVANERNKIVGVGNKRVGFNSRSPAPPPG